MLLDGFTWPTKEVSKSRWENALWSLRLIRSYMSVALTTCATLPTCLSAASAAEDLSPAPVKADQQRACVTCHGENLQGVGLIPPLAGRSPTYSSTVDFRSPPVGLICALT
jgi:cytochrome c553